MGYPETTDAFAVTDIKNWSTFTRKELPLKKFEEHDVDIAIDACGVCASDVHTITGGWGEDIPLPLCVGHEIIGKAVKVGSKVKDIKVGDRVGVGAQIYADLTCENCKSDNENYCPNQVDTYGAKYPDGTITQGGYSSHVRAHEYFTFKIPESIETAIAAPMLCAGLTVFSPLKRLGAGPGKKVAIVGLGGLGHFGVLFSVALGAETYVLSHSPKKKEDALKMGAKDFIVTGEENWAENWKFKFDFIINAADATDRFVLSDYFSTLKVNGTFHNVGYPDKPLSGLMVQAFAPTGCSFGASHIGSRPEMLEMFELASKLNIKSWVETIDISEEGCKSAVERVYKNDNVRYRLTLTGYDKIFGKRD
ncbi:NADP-dependent alcohol dehydrogenase C [Amniculicola lignicola CBS 123094]|uniref:alcohol dehydrogenase (NADP(+)) n=1 Tax=Amniculicola lignicola CBS 123094 TaxID=1392246 RepID=A0A6A5WW05_9PLEO|nr:NADP-dependent alcohol dehydrogenase C [Amniculicola lignicola CBS 123094]